MASPVSVPAPPIRKLGRGTGERADRACGASREVNVRPAQRGGVDCPCSAEARVPQPAGAVDPVPAQGSRPAALGYRAAVRAQSPASPGTGRPISQ